MCDLVIWRVSFEKNIVRRINCKLNKSWSRIIACHRRISITVVESRRKQRDYFVNRFWGIVDLALYFQHLVSFIPRQNETCRPSVSQIGPFKHISAHFRNLYSLSDIGGKQYKRICAFGDIMGNNGYWNRIKIDLD